MEYFTPSGSSSPLADYLNSISYPYDTVYYPYEGSCPESVDLYISCPESGELYYGYGGTFGYAPDCQRCL